MRTSRIALVYVLVACPAVALAQSVQDIQCKKTETQPECHTRLKCKANEELEDCQKRMLKCTAGEKLDDCEKRVAAQPAKQGANAAAQGGDNTNRGGARDAGDTGRGRDRSDDAGDRRGRDRSDDADREVRDDGGGRSRSRGGGGGSRGRRRGGGEGRSGGFEANKTFGLGLELGEPDGLAGKVFVSDSRAIDFGVGWIYRHYYYGDGFHLYADFLFHPAVLASNSTFELPLYIGPGIRYWDFSYCDNQICGFGGSAVGIRMPVGVAFDFNNTPLDIFIQVVPVLDFLGGDYYMRYRDREHFGIDLSVGLRYWFK